MRDCWKLREEIQPRALGQPECVEADGERESQEGMTCEEGYERERPSLHAEATRVELAIRARLGLLTMYISIVRGYTYVH